MRQAGGRPRTTPLGAGFCLGFQTILLLCLHCFAEHAGRRYVHKAMDDQASVASIQGSEGRGPTHA